MTIRKLFRDFINDKIDYKIVSFVESGSNAGCFIVQDIKTVISSGVKDIYKIEQNNSYAPLEITDKHRLLTDNGWKTLQDYKDSNTDKIIIKDELLALNDKEAFYNLKVDENNIISAKSFEDRFKLLENLPVISVKPYGKEETYDIEVDGEYHNFIANGLVVHNSRAIPFEKMLKVIEEEPFYPIAYQKQHKGMQGTEYFTDESDIAHCDYMWSCAIESALAVAEDMYEHGVSKQIINRTVEPYTWVTQLCTGTRESFEHLFEQRCPIYEVPYYINDPVEEGNKLQRTLGGCSKKEIMKSVRENKLDSEVFSWNDLDWLQHNKGQAEIHFMDLAEKMYDALNESEPVEMKGGDWHIPFSEGAEFTPDMTLKDKIVLSCAITARTSYTTIADNEVLTLEKAKKIYEKCVEQGHFSVVSHCARCMSDYQYDSWIKGQSSIIGHFDGSDHYEITDDIKGYNKQFRGFLSLRQFIEDGKEIK